MLSWIDTSFFIYSLHFDIFLFRQRKKRHQSYEEEGSNERNRLQSPKYNIFDAF